LEKKKNSELDLGGFLEGETRARGHCCIIPYIARPSTGGSRKNQGIEKNEPHIGKGKEREKGLFSLIDLINKPLNPN
jgi:hypothetical protein